MDAANPFAQTPSTPEPIIAQVLRQLLAEAGDDGPMPTSSMDEVVERVVRELWGSRVKTFIPVLALRQTREVLRQQALAALSQTPEAPQVADVAAAPPTGHAVRDVMGAVRDVMPLDRRDVLPVDERDVLPL